MAFKYRADIDGLRAVAVMPVVLGHAGIPGFGGGFVGVDVFFVISGFLITALIQDELESQKFSYRSFYLRRIRRLLPALFIMMFATFLMGWLLLPPAGLEALGRSVLSVLFLGSNVWLWQNTGDYFGAAAEITPLLHTWSLAVEEQFYLVFPLLLVICIRSCLSARSIMILLTVLGFAGSFYFTDRHPTAAFYLMPARAWEFGVGVVLALSKPKSSCNLSAVMVGLGLCFIAYSVATFVPGTPMPGANALLPVSGAALVIAGGASENALSKILGSTFLVGIGLLSYSLYLWHWPVQVTTRLIAGVYHMPIGLGLLSIAASILLAYVSRRWIEEPMRRQRCQRITASVLSPVCLALVCLGVASVKGAGLPSRIDSARLAEYQAATQTPPIHERCMSRGADDPPCALSSAVGRPEVLIWGDSHAGAALPAFQEWAGVTNREAVAATKAACPPILGVIRADRREKSCSAHNAATMKWLRETPSIDTVILHARWPLVLFGERAPGEAGGDARFSDPSGREVRMDDALSATVSSLRMMGKRVVLVGSVPELGLDVPQAYFSQSRLFGRPIMRWLPADPKIRTHRADLALRRIALKHGAELIELSDSAIEWIETPLRYADDDHLSAHGAMQLVLPALNQALPPAPSQKAPIAVLSAVRSLEIEEQLFGPR